MTGWICSGCWPRGHAKEIRGVSTTRDQIAAYIGKQNCSEIAPTKECSSSHLDRCQAGLHDTTAPKSARGRWNQSSSECCAEPKSRRVYLWHHASTPRSDEG